MILNLPIPIYQGLELQVCTTTPGLFSAENTILDFKHTRQAFYQLTCINLNTEIKSHWDGKQQDQRMHSVIHGQSTWRASGQMPETSHHRLQHNQLMIRNPTHSETEEQIQATWEHSRKCIFTVSNATSFIQHVFIEPMIHCEMKIYELNMHTSLITALWEMVEGESWIQGQPSAIWRLEWNT